jgi:hypothetical protein
MFVATRNDQLVAMGQSKNQVKRKLIQMGLNVRKYQITEEEDGTCPVCGALFELDKDNMLVTTNNSSCFFCKGGIKIS